MYGALRRAPPSTRSSRVRADAGNRQAKSPRPTGRGGFLVCLPVRGNHLRISAPRGSFLRREVDRGKVNVWPVPARRVRRALRPRHDAIAPARKVRSGRRLIYLPIKKPAKKRARIVRAGQLNSQHQSIGTRKTTTAFPTRRQSACRHHVQAAPTCFKSPARGSVTAFFPSPL